MICLLGLLQNLNIVVSSDSSSFMIQPTQDTPLTWVTLVYMKSSAELALYKRLIDLFIGAEMGAESAFISQTSQFPSIDHVV